MMQLTRTNLLKMLMLLLAALSLLLFIRHAPAILNILSSMDNFRDYIRSTGHWGPVMFILFQILQIVIAPIPGEVVQIAGGYIYGTGLGTFYTMVGMVIGSAMAFYFTRFIGRSMIERYLDRKNFKWLAVIKDQNKLSAFLLLFFFIPGLPKDLLVYVAALTPISSLRFFTLLILGRLPWIAASAVVGSSLHLEQYGVTIVISVIAVLGFILGYWKKDKLIQFISKFEKGKFEKGAARSEEASAPLKNKAPVE